LDKGKIAQDESMYIVHAMGGFLKKAYMSTRSYSNLLKTISTHTKAFKKQ
jgi:hypothetical protein